MIWKQIQLYNKNKLFEVVKVNVIKSVVFLASEIVPQSHYVSPAYTLVYLAPLLRGRNKGRGSQVL